MRRPPKRFSFITAAGYYLREVPSDPAPEFEGELAEAYWVESSEPAARVRIREDATALLSGDGMAVPTTLVSQELGPLRFAASAAANLVREKSCHLVIGDIQAGDRIAGYLD